MNEALTSEEALSNALASSASCAIKDKTENASWTVMQEIKTLTEPQDENANSSRVSQVTRGSRTGHAQRRAVSSIRHVPSRATSSVSYRINRDASYAPSRASLPVRSVSSGQFTRSRSVSPSRGLPSRDAASVARHPSGFAASPPQFAPGRAHSSRARLPRRRSLSTRRFPNRAGAAKQGQMISPHAHDTPRRYRNLNDKVYSEGKIVVPPKRQRIIPQKSVTYGGSLSGGDDGQFLGSLGGIRLNSGSRTAYDFVDSNKLNMLQANITEGGLEASDQQGRHVAGDKKPWLPTGIYAVFLITLWTAVLKLVNSVEDNGPSVCTQGEETRLWICAGSFVLALGLAEAFWERKNLLKVLFSMCCLFGYFIILHTEPLSCRLGEGKVTEISKWQSAINFFTSALLGICIYQHTLEALQGRKRSREEEKIRRRREQTDFEELPEFIL